MAIVDAGANQTPALETLYRHINYDNMQTRKGILEKVSKMQEKGDADVGKIETMKKSRDIVK